MIFSVFRRIIFDLSTMSSRFLNESTRDKPIMINNRKSSVHWKCPSVLFCIFFFQTNTYDFITSDQKSYLSYQINGKKYHLSNRINVNKNHSLQKPQHYSLPTLFKEKFNSTNDQITVFT